MNPELLYILELLRRSPRGYDIRTTAKHPDKALIICPDNTMIKIIKTEASENKNREDT